MPRAGCNAPTIELKKTGLLLAALRGTVERYNRFCPQGRDEDFHRGDSKFRNKR